MPSNNLDLYRFIRLPARRRRRRAALAGHADPGDGRPTAPSSAWSSAQVWRYYVIPRVREGLISAARGCCRCSPRSRLGTGPGRHLQSLQARSSCVPLRLPRRRRAHTAPADFPVDLPSEAARGHAAALGRQQHLARRAQSLGRDRRRRHAGDASTTTSIGRVADWLLDLRPPPSPHRPDAAAVERGRALYMASCAACHGYQERRRLRVRRARSSARSSRTRRSAPIAAASIPTPRRFRQRQLASSSRARPTSSSISARPTATPTCRSTGCGCARPICTTARCRRWPTCWRRRRSGRPPSCAAST